LLLIILCIKEVVDVVEQCFPLFQLLVILEDLELVALQFVDIYSTFVGYPELELLHDCELELMAIEMEAGGLVDWDVILSQHLCV